jgi:hypothetical protein
MLVVGMVIGAFAFGAVAANAAKKWDNRPFSGVIEGTTTPTGMSGMTVSTESEGTLIATHVGNSTYTLVSDQDYERHAEEEHPGQCAFIEDGMDGPTPAPPPPGLIITAANGDEIFGHLDDDRSVVCAPDDQGSPMEGDIYHSTMYFNVDGGTGRFTDADGWLFLDGDSTLNANGTSSDEALIIGDIDY